MRERVTIVGNKFIITSSNCELEFFQLGKKKKKKKSFQKIKKKAGFFPKKKKIFILVLMVKMTP